jgi:hypothetical protein
MDQDNITPTDLGGRFVYRNPLDLPSISYADIVSSAAEGVCVEQPDAVRLYRRVPPVFHDDPDRAGLFQPFHDIVVNYPPVFTTSLRDTTLVGFRSVLSHDCFFINDLGHLVPQDILNFVKGLDRSNEVGPLAPEGDEGVFSYAPNGSPEVHLEGPVVLLTSGGAGSFGSFLYRDLIKLVNLIDIPANWRFLIHIAGKPMRSSWNLPVCRCSVWYDTTRVRSTTSTRRSFPACATSSRWRIRNRGRSMKDCGPDATAVSVGVGCTSRAIPLMPVGQLAA